MGFKEELRWLIECMTEKAITHDFRELDKNWLGDGRITLEEALAVVSSVRGNQAEMRPHHFRPSLEVWILKTPSKSQALTWYIKFHRTPEGVKFISFHPSNEVEQ